MTNAHQIYRWTQNVQLNLTPNVTTRSCGPNFHMRFLDDWNVLAPRLLTVQWKQRPGHKQEVRGNN